MLSTSSGGEVTSDIGKADLLNRFYAEQTTLPDENKHSPPHLVSSSRSFHTLRTSSSEVYDVLKSLKKHKSAGNDDIPASLLLFCARGISSSLASLFNRSFAEGSLPLEWKQALVVPVFKRGDKSLPTNYRPISLLSIVSKVIERLVYNKLYSFLSPSLSTRQSGFRKSDGAEFQLLRLVQRWSELLDKSCYVGTVFFDLRKAFDKVWHRGLIAKL